MSRNVVATLLVLGLIGCGGDDGSSASGPASDRTLDELSDDEYESFCTYVLGHEPHLSVSANQLCEVLAVAEHDDAMDCAFSRNRCTNEGAGADTQADVRNQFESVCEDPTQAGLRDNGCTATVGQIKECLDAVTLFWKMSSCHSAQVNPGIPDDCVLIKDTCPALVESYDLRAPR